MIVLSHRPRFTMAGYDRLEAARPHLQALHAETEDVATLGVKHAYSGVYLDKIEAADFGIRMHSEVGKQFPLHCTAMGKIMFSAAEPAITRRLLGRKLEAYTADTIVDPSTLRRELDKVTVDGYAIDREEITRGLVCVAAPIVGISGTVEGAMSCTFPSYVFQERSIQLEICAVQRRAKLT